jgi:hypothetical protein
VALMGAGELALQLDYRKFTDAGTHERIALVGPLLAVVSNVPEGSDTVIPALALIRRSGGPHLSASVSRSH